MFIGKGTWVLRAPPPAAAAAADSAGTTASASGGGVSGGSKVSGKGVERTNPSDDPLHTPPSSSSANAATADKQTGSGLAQGSGLGAGSGLGVEPLVSLTDGAQLLETGFTGVTATFTYNADRSTSASFELQVQGEAEGNVM